MDAIMAIADRHGVPVVEDNAHGLFARYHSRYLGTFGCLATLSFHETKNFTCGEGGALLLNDRSFIERAEIIREKGTDRSRFFRGQVDKYTWVDVGSSYLPSEIVAAFLAAQIEDADAITARRIALWNRYHEAFAPLEAAGHLRRPIVPAHCGHNAHMYYVLLENLDARTRFISSLKSSDIHPVFHYVPLHSAPAGRKYGRASGNLAVTDQTSDRLVRLPLWLPDLEQARVIEAVETFFA
jgi:dTDP-4-amino-4,6-dideoxygalactose transaminase